ncbi:MAG: efflux RND transporter periplasmic adaptor subunit [Vicinamibacterales bacterium]|jgi:HlyD family secretion protein|nr:RND transporter [Acidobacteriota bacterium]MDP7295621.1 efflux RND transporter periplasmic adaptor subunit [Vicinamibacterales bacterium]MDP7672925.1 efflux RND transporter periplasmic adaptor subunit [Vicinamibacterales bacterium]HJO39751.1 efflux RND transporter periplasmic adaptor subunit [Vicinamibacterales bacterium]|tara:strand:+ start:527 stop:1783 length:1257 start_codon:yes stop_codon:yes gene_type:complete
MVDIPRPELARKRKVRRIIYTVVTVAAVALITLGVSRLQPAAPSVDRAVVYMDTVQRGSMLRQVRGTGTLVPEEIRWIPALTDGRVERIILRPGVTVEPDTVILELSNPELEQQLAEAQLLLRAAEADYENLRVKLDSDLLTQRAGAATVEAEYQQARLQAEADTQLAADGLTSDLIMRISVSRAQELGTRTGIEQERLSIASESAAAQLAAQDARVEQVRSTYQLRIDQVERLHVRAGDPGVLQVVPVEVGQSVTPGMNLARVADPTNLKAELRIAETQAKDIQIGQVARVDTRNGVIGGHVSRIDPAVQNGTVTVDVILEDDLPRGARPDLTVDGTVELERLVDVLYVGRPAFGQEESTIGLFRMLNEDGDAARVAVRLGRSSVNTIEILEGLNEGDQVVLSDMSAWDAFDRVRLR